MLLMEKWWMVPRDWYRLTRVQEWEWATLGLKRLKAKLMVAPFFCMKMTQLIHVGLTIHVALWPLVLHSWCQSLIEILVDIVCGFVPHLKIYTTIIGHHIQISTEGFDQWNKGLALMAPFFNKVEPYFQKYLHYTSKCYINLICLYKVLRLENHKREVSALVWGIPM